MSLPNCPVADLSEYVTVPGKIIAIPGTDYVLIAPVKSVEEVAASAAPTPPLSAQIRKRGRPVGKSTPCQCPNCQVSTGDVPRSVTIFISAGPQVRPSYLSY